MNKEFVAALLKAKANFKTIIKNKKVDFVSKKTGVRTHYSYAELDKIHEAVDEALAQNGFIILQPIVMTDGTAVLKTALYHISGESLEGAHPLSKDLAAQELGSEITYLRRYCLASILGVVAVEDDDGSHATESKQHAKQEPSKTSPHRQHLNTEYENVIIPRGPESIRGKPISILSEEQMDNALSYWRGRLQDGSEKRTPIMDEYLQALEGALKERMRMPSEDIKF